MTQIITLQNTPTPTSIATESVEFQSNGVTLKGTLFAPAGRVGRLPAAVITGAWTTVKEQMAGTYARELAARGMIALAFDFTGWGQSNGAPRYVEDPAVKTRDIHAAVAYLCGRDDVDVRNVSGLGVCASSGYMAEVAADNSTISKLALVAPWLHDSTLAAAIYGGTETVASLIADSQAAAADASPRILTAASTTDATSPMFQAPYYTEEHRGLIPEYDNKFSILTWEPWLTYDAQASAARLNKPILLVGSAGMALPAGAEAYEQATNAPLQKVWLADDVSQFDFYDRKDIVQTAADAVANFFGG